MRSLEEFLGHQYLNPPSFQYSQRRSFLRFNPSSSEPIPSFSPLFVNMKVSTLAPLILSPVALAASRHTLRQASLKRGLLDVCVGLDLDVNLLDILPDSELICCYAHAFIDFH